MYGLVSQFESDVTVTFSSGLEETIPKINLDINCINILNEPSVLPIRENPSGRNRPESASA